jgi:4-hydroxy-tetrahydrodipicolinate reductase
MTPLLIVGYGRMGRLVERIAPEYGFDVAGKIDSAGEAAGGALEPDRLRNVEVAVDFSTAEAVPSNLPRLARAGVNVVVGTTGWQADEDELREVVRAAGTGVVVAPNFSVGVALFTALVQRAAGLVAEQAAFGAWIHEIHHAAKRDAPCRAPTPSASTVRPRPSRSPMRRGIEPRSREGRSPPRAG